MLYSSSSSSPLMENPVDLLDLEARRKVNGEVKAKCIRRCMQTVWSCIRVSVSLYGHSRTMLYHLKPTETVGKLMTRLRGSLYPQGDPLRHIDHRSEFRDADVALIFKGRDLLQEDRCRTLGDWGIQDEDVLFMLRRGSHFPGNLQCAELGYLIEAIETPADSNIKDIVSQCSCDEKIIFVDIPVSEGIEVRISHGLKFEDGIVDVEDHIVSYLRKQSSNGGEHWEAWKDPGPFDLLLNKEKLCSGSALLACGIKEHDTLKLLWNSHGLDLSMAVHTNNQSFFRITHPKYSDTVRQLKIRIRQVTGVPVDKQLVRYQKKLLLDDSKSLADYGIMLCPPEIFPWRPHINALELFVRIEGIPLFCSCTRMIAMEHTVSHQGYASSMMFCPSKNCTWHTELRNDSYHL